MALGKTLFENTVGKEENAGNQHFLLSPQCFLIYQRKYTSFEITGTTVSKCFHFGHC